MGGNRCNQQCLVDDVKKDLAESESYYGIGLVSPFLIFSRQQQLFFADLLKHLHPNNNSSVFFLANL
jgi:hypothetical protein